MLRELHETKASRNFVFPSVRGDDRPIARSTLNQAVKALGLDVEHFVLHDFRRTATTHLREMTAHADAPDRSAEEVPERGTQRSNAEKAVDQRRIMQLWADFVDAQIKGTRSA